VLAATFSISSRSTKPWRALLSPTVMFSMNGLEEIGSILFETASLNPRSRMWTSCRMVESAAPSFRRSTM